MWTNGVFHLKDTQETEKTTRLWANLCFVAGGVACDWYCAFRWFSGSYSSFAFPVLRCMTLIVILCLLASVLATRIAKGKLQEAAAVFFLVSAVLLGNLLMWWTTHR